MARQLAALNENIGRSFTRQVACGDSATSRRDVLRNDDDDFDARDAVSSRAAAVN
jgi:hypothetical protein